MVDPVFAEDGNLYERTEILKWIATNRISPLDPSCPMDASCIFPSHAVKQLIEGLIASGKLDDELCARYYQRKEALSNASELVEEDDPIGATDLPIPPAQRSKCFEPLKIATRTIVTTKAGLRVRTSLMRTMRRRLAGF